MLRSTAKCLLLLLCSWLLVGPQFFLQIGAWSWMVVSYSQESSIQVAFQETFSGERPCGLCKIIQASDPSESDPPKQIKASTDELRLLLPAPPSLHLRPLELTAERMMPVPIRADSIYAKTPTPPPKLQG